MSGRGLFEPQKKQVVHSHSTQRTPSGLAHTGRHRKARKAATRVGPVGSALPKM